MKFCTNCGTELSEGLNVCSNCGAEITGIVTDGQAPEKTEEVISNVAEPVSQEPVVEVNTSVPGEKTIPKMRKVLSKKLLLIICGAVVLVAVLGACIWHGISLKKYEEDLHGLYANMTYAAERAEDYCSLQSKVWRNCIMEDSSSETDKYTKDEYGLYYDDFNDALSKFYEDKSLDYRLVELYDSDIKQKLAELRDCPSKFEDEYEAIQQMYVAYNNLVDLMLGDSLYSLNTFTEALEDAKAEFKTAKSTAELKVG